MISQSKGIGFYFHAWIAREHTKTVKNCAQPSMANNNVFEFVVVLRKNYNLSGLGFDLLGKQGFPHIIYDVTDSHNNQVI